MLDAELPRLRRGDKLADWVIERALAPGEPAFYRAHHVDDEEKLATVKVIRKSVEAINMLRREVRILRSLDHPAIPKVFDFGFSQMENGVWIAQEVFDGTTLAERLRQDPMDWRLACTLFAQLAGALKEAHRKGIIHQDVHPERVVIGPNRRVQFTDFDAAVEEENIPEGPPDDFGAMSYAAPELVGEARSARTDLYALGVMFFEVVAHKSAFPATAHPDRDSQKQFLAWKRTDAPLLDPGEHLPLWLVNLIQKASEPDPDRRLPDADAFLGWLDAARDSWEVQEEAPQPVVSEPLAEPPVIMMVAPSIGAEPVPMLVTGDQPIPRSPLETMRPMLYGFATMLGVFTGLALGVLFILMFDMAVAG